jgi:glycine oxidase
LSEEVEAAVLRPDECSVDNRLLTNAILTAAQRNRVEIFSGKGAKALWREGDRCRGLILQDETVEAAWTIIAAGSFSTAIEGASAYAPVRPAKGQMVALRSEDLEIERVLWSEHIYLVPRNNGRILAGATVEYVGFDKRTTAGGIEKILSAAIELAPHLANARIEETWAGLRPDSPDHLPILGPADLEGLMMATGHFRSGILLAPITARLIREWITEQNVSMDWDRFSPLRFQTQKADATKKMPA